MRVGTLLTSFGEVHGECKAKAGMPIPLNPRLLEPRSRRSCAWHSPRPRARQIEPGAVALNYFAYNFVKIHRTLRMSPAMAAGVTDRLWSVEDLVALWESEERERE